MSITLIHFLSRASRALVFLGAHDIKNSYEPGQIRMMIYHKDFIIYPTWNPRRLKDDIALVRLPKSVKYNGTYIFTILVDGHRETLNKFYMF